MGQVRFITGIERLNSSRVPNVSALRAKAKRSEQKLKHVLHEDDYEMDHKLTGVEERGRKRIEAKPVWTWKRAAAFAAGLAGAYVLFNTLRRPSTRLRMS